LDQTQATGAVLSGLYGILYQVTSYLVFIVYLSLVKEKHKIVLLFESRLPYSRNDVFFFKLKKILPSVAILDSNVIVDHTTSRLQHVITLVNPNLHFCPL
jgi:hypothetical protein